MSEVMSGAASGAAIGTQLGGPGWGTAIGAVIGGAGGYFSGKRKKRAQGIRSQGMQDAMEALKVDTKKEKNLDRSSIKSGMNWYRSNVLDTGDGRAAYAQMKDDPTMQDILQRRKAQADEGIGAKEMQARRNLDHSQTSQAMAQLGLQMGSALSGYAGSTKENIMASQNTRALKGIADRELQMQLANERVKREGLDDYQQTYTAQRMFDIRQAKDKLGSMFTYGTSEAQRESTARSIQRQTESQMILEQALAKAEEEAQGGFLGMF